MDNLLFHYPSWMTRAWLALAALLLTLVLLKRPPAWICTHMAVDFRGYYASAQIAWQRSFAEVYNPQAQADFQADLLMHCPGDAAKPILVAMPYLPIFTLLFLPLPLLNFSASFAVYSVIQILLLVGYFWRVAKASGAKTNAWQLLTWAISIPAIFNWFLGQSNVLVVIFLGEFALSLARKRPEIAGVWLGLLLIKPNTLILLLPALLLGRHWRVLAGFVTSAGVILLGSAGLAGINGMLDAVQLAARFAGPLIETAETMMNWRALALHLTGFIPGWLAWGIAISGMVGVAQLIWAVWLRPTSNYPETMIWQVLAAYTGTCAVTWHSHIYMLMPLAPLLFYLELRQQLPLAMKMVWLFGPPVSFLVVFGLWPAQSETWFGLSMLGMNLWIISQLPKLRTV